MKQMQLFIAKKFEQFFSNKYQHLLHLVGSYARNLEYKSQLLFIETGNHERSKGRTSRFYGLRKSAVYCVRCDVGSYHASYSHRLLFLWDIYLTSLRDVLNILDTGNVKPVERRSHENCADCTTVEYSASFFFFFLVTQCGHSLLWGVCGRDEQESFRIKITHFQVGLSAMGEVNFWQWTISPAEVCCLTFRHRASCILGQAFHYSPESAFYIFNQQIYFIIWYLLDRASLI